MGQPGAVLQSLDWSYLHAAIVLYVLHLVVRGQRWQVLLAPLRHLTVRDAFAYVNIGYMANDLLPLRVGEVIRAVLLGKKNGIIKRAVLATVVVQRLLGILSLAALTVILMFTMPIPPLVKQTAVAFGGVSCLVAAGHPFTANVQWSVPRRFKTDRPSAENASVVSLVRRRTSGCEVAGASRSRLFGARLGAGSGLHLAGARLLRPRLAMDSSAYRGCRGKFWSGNSLCSRICRRGSLFGGIGAGTMGRGAEYGARACHRLPCDGFFQNSRVIG